MSSVHAGWNAVAYNPEDGRLIGTEYALASLVATHVDSLLHRVMARVGSKLSADELQTMVRVIQTARGYR